MREPTLEEAATRLGSVYAELVYAGHTLDAGTLPNWIEPERLRPAGGFDIGTKLLLALRKSPWYFTQLGDTVRRQAGYPNLEFDNLRASRFQYEKDLRVFRSRLKPALAKYTQDALSRQEQELRKLHGRFGKPGIEDELHASFQRIWSSVEEVLPGGVRPQPGENVGTGTGTENAPASSDAGETSSENLPGGAAGPVDPEASQQNQNPDDIPTDFVERYRMLRAIKAERERLQSEAKESGNALNNEIADLLATIAVHPEVVDIARHYVWSPIKGTEYTQSAVDRAIEAVADLRQRLTRPESDDAWNYAPLVVGTITQLKLHELPAVPEFSVALGAMLGRTKTNFYLGAATILIVGLSLVFTGPVGAVVAGSLDLALAGISLGITRLREHEQEIAATASDFSPDDQKLAAHTTGVAGALDAAGALLSAIALVGSVRQLMKVRELLTIESKGVKVIRSSKLDSDTADHAGGIGIKIKDANGRESISYELEDQINATLGNPNARTEEAIERRKERTGTRTRVGGNYTPDKMRRQGAKGGPEVSKDPGKTAPKEPLLQPEMPREYQGSVREYDLADLPDRPDAAREPPDLEALYKRERVTTREQITGLFERDPFYPKLEEQKAMLIQSGAPDPIIPNLKFSKKNPPHVDHIIPENQVRKFDGFTELDMEYQREVLHMEKNLELVSSSVNLSRGDMPYSLWDGTKEFKIPPEIHKDKIAQEKALAIEIQNKIYSLLEQQRQLRGTTRPSVMPIKAGARLTGDVSRGLRLVNERETKQHKSGSGVPEKW